MPEVSTDNTIHEDAVTNFSFLLPTRGRPDQVARLFDSIVEMTARPNELEIILALDHDDTASLEIADDRLRIKKVILDERLPMGGLNNACFEASCGRYIMFMNDDVILRTKDWDRIVLSTFSMFPDDIALIHVNDLLFRERLCCFPLLSRKACLAVGLCPREYKRYKIDDNIYDIYSLLAFLGHKRIVYLPDVIFEHKHYSTDLSGATQGTFQSRDNKLYAPNPEILADDDALFHSLFPQRKQNALTLARMIHEDHNHRVERRARETLEQAPLDARTEKYEGLIESAQDSYSYRRNDFIRRLPVYDGGGAQPRVTVAIVSGDIRNAHATECLTRVKDHTSNYDLLILDNNGGGEFSHPREMNRALQAAETDYLVLMDDDVNVEDGWLEGMLNCMDHDTGVVTPMHTDKDGNLTYSGLYLKGDGTEAHAHLTDAPPAAREAQSLCSAIMLIDMNKCGHLRMDEAYAKYYFDAAYGLSVWEAGFKCVCTPDVRAIHLGGATQVRGLGESGGLWDRDGEFFVHDWLASGRLAALERGIWQHYPFTRVLVELPARINGLFEKYDAMDIAEFKSELAAILSQAKDFRLFRGMLENRLCEVSAPERENRDPDKIRLCAAALMWLAKTAALPQVQDSVAVAAAT